MQRLESATAAVKAAFVTLSSSEGSVTLARSEVAHSHQSQSRPDHHQIRPRITRSSATAAPRSTASAGRRRYVAVFGKRFAKDKDGRDDRHTPNNHR